MSEIRIPEARFVADAGNTVIVQPVGTPLQPGNKYYSAYEHKGRIQCLHCEAPVKLHEKQPSSGGSSGAGRSFYFAATRKHDDDCLLPLRPASNRKTPIDRTKGYVLKIATAEFSELFNQKSGVYAVSEKGRLRLIDEDLRDRETFMIRSADDLLRFVGKADVSRIKPSRVVFQNNSATWEEFFIRQGTPSRLANFIDQLEARKPGTEPLFAAMEVTTTAYHDPFPRRHGTGKSTRFKVPPAPVAPIVLGKDENGKKIVAQINIYIDERDNMRERHALISPQTYLVMGEVRHKKFETDDRITHYLNIKITDGRQATPVNIANLHAAKSLHKGKTPTPEGP